MSKRRPVEISRSREGAWIEIDIPHQNYDDEKSRSREGAWIEMYRQQKQKDWLEVAPARERGLKFVLMQYYAVPYGRSREGAWIEITWRAQAAYSGHVAPARERGLKSKGFADAPPPPPSLPRGSVD